MLKKFTTKFSKKYFNNQANNQGSTIIELLISLMIVGMVATAIAVSSTYSIKNTGEARFKQVATTLAQEVIEKSRAEKNRLGIVGLSSAVGTNTYCFNNIPDKFDYNLPPSEACVLGDTKTLAGTDFTRNVTFTTSSGEITVAVTVSWKDGETEREVSLTQNFKQADNNF